jgi:hypothetical protein
MLSPSYIAQLIAQIEARMALLMVRKGLTESEVESDTIT